MGWDDMSYIPAHFLIVYSCSCFKSKVFHIKGMQFAIQTRPTALMPFVLFHSLINSCCGRRCISFNMKSQWTYEVNGFFFAHRSSPELKETMARKRKGARDVSSPARKKRVAKSVLFFEINYLLWAIQSTVFTHNTLISVRKRKQSVVW